MKSNHLAVIVSFAFLPCAASAVGIYDHAGNKIDFSGMVSGLHYFSDDKNQDGDLSYVRTGFRGETKISDRLTGYGQWQTQFNTSQPESENQVATTRLGFVGISIADYGSLDYGRNVGVLYDVLSQTDMQPEFDAQTYNTDQFMFRRGNSLATYRNHDFFGRVRGLDFALQYQGKNQGEGEPGTRDVLRQNGQGYGMSVAYAFGNGFKGVAAFTSAERTDAQNHAPGIMGQGNRAEAWSASLKYEARDVYLGVMYTKALNASRFGNSSGAGLYGYANQSDIFEAFAQYTSDSGWVPFIAYSHARAQDLGSAGNGKSYGNQDLVKFIDFGGSYLFNKNMQAYVDYKINLIDKSDFSTAAGVSVNDILAVRVVYQF